MYLDFFKLQDYPFRLTPDPRYLFLSQAHSRAKAYMDFSVWKQSSFVVITGDIGAGKTTLIENLLSDTEQNVLVARIYQTQLDEQELLQAILVEFGFKPFNAGKVELLNMLKEFLLEQHAQNRLVLLVIDEAQNLSPRVLEEIRLLSGMETHTEKMLNVLLVGQPELNETLDSPGLEQLVQRIRLRFHVGSLSVEETDEYIKHRLQVAGAEDVDIFSAEVVESIYHYTGGVPRLVNILCDTILLGAFVEDISSISPKEVITAVEELQWVAYDERSANKYHAQAYALRPNLGIPPKLIVMDEGKTLGEFFLDKQTVTLGRSPNNDVQLNDSKVSGSHAQIVTTRKHSFLIDLGSTNGTYMDGRAIKKYKLKDGDVFSITNKYRIKYMKGDEEVRPYSKDAGDDTISIDDTGKFCEDGTEQKA